MRTAADALRSLKRYVAEGLPEDWDVRWADEEGVFDRPVAMVTATTPTGMTGPAFSTDMSQGFAVHLYPEVEAEAQDSLLRATEVEEAMFALFREGVQRGHPMRVPLYDYEGVSADAGSDIRDDRDYLRVVDLSVQRMRDPDDALLYTVICEARCVWTRPRRVPSEREVVSVTGEWTPGQG